MRRPAVARLVLVAAVATGVLSAAVRLDQPPPQSVAAVQTAPVAAVDESLPHEHVVDPETGGLVSLAPAEGVLPAPTRLGPMHVDPVPPGVDLDASTGTTALLNRAARQQAAREAPGRLFAAGATAPLGTPAISTLDSHVAPSCSGTGTDGNRVQVLYAHERGTASRLAAVRPVIRNEVANVDDVFAVSARQTGGERRVRWVRDAACVPVIKDVTVPAGTPGADFYRTITALQRLGYADRHRKYLVFADANAFCGIGTVYRDPRLVGNDNDGKYASYARVDANCWSSGYSVAAHELIHTLGGVLPTAPHATAQGHCFDESDLMCYADDSRTVLESVCERTQEPLLDCRHDDYFTTAPEPGTFLAQNWNTADSSFLDVLTRAPDARLVASRTAAQTGDRVTFTATSSRQVTWSWSRSSSACSLTRPVTGRAVLRCPSTVTGPVTVTATATEVGTRTTRTAKAAVTLVRAPAPRVSVVAPTGTVAGRSFAVRVSFVGKTPATYAWTAGRCAVTAPRAAATRVTCPRSTSRRDVTVVVVATQADGQSRRAARTVRVAGS